MKRILITGGAGFIGSHTADVFLQHGWRVVVFDNLSSGKLAYLNVFHPELRIVQADILDYPLLAGEVKAADVVLHLAALASVPRSIEDPIQSNKVNSLGFLHVLQAIRESGKPIRLVYASSAAVYGRMNAPCSDEVPLSAAALSPYALEKANSERYADLYSQLFGIHSLGLRYFNVYGERQDPKSPYSGVISKFMDCYQKNQPLTLFGDGLQSRDFIHVADVARANYLAVQSDYHGVCNIATGVSETLLQLISYIEQASGKSLEKQFMKSQAGDIKTSIGSTALSEKILSFRSSIPLADGIRTLLV